MKEGARIAIIGTGNIGTAIAEGLTQHGGFPQSSISLTRRKTELLDGMRAIGFAVEKDNKIAVKNSEIIIIAVEPQQLDRLLEEIGCSLIPGKHIIISVVSGVSINKIAGKVVQGVAIVRAMPNIAIAVGESITCLASDSSKSDAISIAESVFNTVGITLVINEEQMTAATALGACGVAFFLRAIRAASQGGIEIGFHSDEALFIAAQTEKGAAALLLASHRHPEYEIDRVTTPRGCTIAGLNQMEHEGFSSAMIKGITISADKASKLYPKDK